MRNVVAGTLCSVGLLMILANFWSTADSAYAQRSGSDPSSQQGLITLTSPVDENRQQLTIIDPRSRVVAVYYVERSTGEIELKSVRNIHWDLQMLEFNSVDPKPQEIRALLQK